MWHADVAGAGQQACLDGPSFGGTHIQQQPSTLPVLEVWAELRVQCVEGQNNMRHHDVPQVVLHHSRGFDGLVEHRDLKGMLLVTGR